MSGHGDVRLLAQLGQEEVTIGDFATAQVADTFGLAYLVGIRNLHGIRTCTS
ncbi:MAG: hypothetical protein WKF47_11800 [Geodermatophilaceae bacterium]